MRGPAAVENSARCVNLESIVSAMNDLPHQPQTFTPLKEHPDVTYIKLEGKELYLVATAHISLRSVELVERCIREVQPNSIAVELCGSRIHSLQNPDRWKNTDIVAVIKEGKVFLLLAQLLLASFQKRLGDQLECKPGSEMLKAIEMSEETGATLVLADRDIRITLKRVWGSLGLMGTVKLLWALITSPFQNEKIDEAEIERMKQADALEELMREFSAALPGVRETLIDERDQYLAAKIVEAPGPKIVAVVGAGHVPGIKHSLHQSIDVAAIEELPPRWRYIRYLGWIIPALVIGLMVYGFFSFGSAKAFEMFGAWFWINAFAGAIGSALAFAHPLTILVAFLVSPFTSLNPLIAAGWVAGIVEALLRRPKVSDFETIMEDLGTVRGMWSNGVSHIILVVALTNLCGTAGTLIGVERIARLLS